MASAGLSSVDSVVSVVRLSLAFPSNKTGHHTKKLFMHRLSRTEKAATSNKQGYSLNNPWSTLHKIENLIVIKFWIYLKYLFCCHLSQQEMIWTNQNLSIGFIAKLVFFIKPADHKYCKIWKNLAFNMQESKISVSKWKKMPSYSYNFPGAGKPMI